MDNEMYIGVAEDTRPPEQKARDYHHEELAGAVPLVWREKPQSEWKKYSVRNQDGSSSCVAQSTAKSIEVMTKTIASAHPIYRRRSNFPGTGMYLQNTGEIAYKSGTTDEASDVSQNIGEDQMNRDVTVDTPIKIGGYFFVSTKSIDQVAEAIEAHGHCLLIVMGSLSEWTDRPVYNPDAPKNLFHCVTGVDYFMSNGEKCILIEDSWGKFYGLEGQRIITENYLYNRFTSGMYFIPRVTPPDTKPHHTFTHYLRYGMVNDDVRALQDILKYEGIFPASQPSTGKFYNITANSLKKWQVAHGIMDFANVIDPTKIVFGPKSMALANSLYGG